MRIVAGKWRGRKLLAPPLNVRPVSSRLKTSLFSVLGAQLEAARVLDLCAGVGSLGLESLSRGAASAHFVDTEQAQIQALRAWITDVEPTADASYQVGDALTVPLSPSFDIVFCDPPFAVWKRSDSLIWQRRPFDLLDPDGAALAVFKLPKNVEFQPPEGFLQRRRAVMGDSSYLLFAQSP